MQHGHAGALNSTSEQQHSIERVVAVQHLKVLACA